MCGIVGIRSLTGQPVRADEVLGMADVITHRGPDDFGYFIGSGIGLAMRRLQIIDLETGRQPIHNEDETVWVVLNGEIYNFKQKRAELQRLGHNFYTATDTEVIVHLYEEFGADCVDHLRGMFSFALWDTRRRTLLLARDRVGIKPLYYGIFGERVAFASEVKCFLTLPEVERRLDWASVQHLFTFLVTPPGASVVEGIHKLEPGQVLIASDETEPTVRRYWDLDFEPDAERGEADIVEELRSVLREAVDLHMVSDVPVGAFLSGGIDSSAVVANMADLGDRPVKTFAIGFSEAAYSELEHARTVAGHLGTDHRELTLEPDVFEELEDLVWYLDEPFGDSSAIPTYMVSRLAAEDVTVVLSGDGGDEVFAGYDKYVAAGRDRRWDRLPKISKQLARVAHRFIPEGRPGHRFSRHHSLSGSERYLDYIAFFSAEQHRRLFTRETLRKFWNCDPLETRRSTLGKITGDWLAALQYTDFHHYLPTDILTKVDRMSMAHSIETRVPLLDHELVEFAARIPSSMKLQNGNGKLIFKKAMRGVLPDAILDRPKQGFAIPLDRWFRGRIGGYLQELLLSPRALERGIFQPDYLRRLIALHDRGRPLGSELWTLCSFELWCRRFLDGAPDARGRAGAVDRLRANSSRVNEAAV